MKKNVFIVTSYPYNENRINVLKECLKSLKHPEFDIILATNYPIENKEINDMCDFMVYDKQDIKSWADYNIDFIGKSWYIDFPHMSAEIRFDNAYHYDIYRLIYLATGLASSLGYEFFYYVEGDCEFSEQNITDFLDLKKDTLEKNKQMVFFQRDVNPDRGMEGFQSAHFATVIFGGKPKYFQEKLILPLEPEEWVKDYMLIGFAFELFFSFKFKHLIDDFSVYDISIQNRVKRIGKLHKSDETGLNTMLFFNDENPENAYYLVHNNYTDYPAIIETYIDDILTADTFTLYPRYVHYLTFKISDILNKKMKRVVYLDNKFYISNEIFCSESELSKLRKINVIKFH
jgi:hypothetical protein